MIVCLVAPLTTLTIYSDFFQRGVSGGGCQMAPSKDGTWIGPPPFLLSNRRICCNWLALSVELSTKMPPRLLEMLFLELYVAYKRSLFVINALEV